MRLLAPPCADALALALAPASDAAVEGSRDVDDDAPTPAAVLLPLPLPLVGRAAVGAVEFSYRESRFLPEAAPLAWGSP